VYYGSVEVWEADSKNKKKPARAGWPRRLALVRATPHAQVSLRKVSSWIFLESAQFFPDILTDQFRNFCGVRL